MTDSQNTLGYRFTPSARLVGFAAGGSLALSISYPDLWSGGILSLYINKPFWDPLWHLIQPIMTTIVFTIIFGNIARLSTDDLPPFLFYMAGNTVWVYFSTLPGQHLKYIHRQCRHFR